MSITKKDYLKMYEKLQHYFNEGLKEFRINFNTCILPDNNKTGYLLEYFNNSTYTMVDTFLIPSKDGTINIKTLTLKNNQENATIKYFGKYTSKDYYFYHYSSYLLNLICVD